MKRSLLDRLPSPAWILAAGAVVIALIIVLGVTSKKDAAPTAPDEPAPIDLKLGATDVCHQEVESHLKAPATAKYSNEVVTHTGDRYTVEGKVDSENGFGALLRSDFTCHATFVSGDTWNPVVATVR